LVVDVICFGAGSNLGSGDQFDAVVVLLMEDFNGIGVNYGCDHAVDRGGRDGDAAVLVAHGNYRAGADFVSKSVPFDLRGGYNGSHEG
jgi:hypothetical protein